MVIGIDASRALKRQRTGTEVHNAEIIKHLVAIDSIDTFRLYSSVPPFGDMQKIRQPQAASQNLAWRVMPWPRGWTLVRLSLEMLIRPPDVLFVPAHILPLVCPKRSVVMIHDIGFDHFRPLYRWTDVWYHRFAVRFAKRFAGHILTPSAFTRQDLHQKYAIPLKKMTVVHHGFNPSAFRPAKQSEKSPNPIPYFYFIGRLEHKKNIVRMLEAFSRFKQKTGLPHQFLLAGRPGFGWETIKAAHGRLPLVVQGDVRFLGFVASDEAHRYLRHAAGLIFTTLFEGFGLPVLEAFASGCPVIASNTTSLPEIVGLAGLTVDPTSVEQIATAMEKMATDRLGREKLILAGNARYKVFSWDKAARETLAVLRAVARG